MKLVDFKILILSLIMILFSGCLMHAVYGDDIRIQFINKSAFKFKEFEIYSEKDSSDNIVIFENEIMPKELSSVETINYTGNLNIQVQSADTTCEGEDCWNTWDLGRITLEGGSIKFVVTGDTQETLKYEIK